MAKGRRFISHSGATSTGAGTARKTRQHNSFGLWIEAANLDTTNDTLEVTLEASRDGNHYSTIDRGAPEVSDIFSRTADDFQQSDSDNSVYATCVFENNVTVEYVRANVTSITDDSGSDLEVDTYIFLGGWTGSGKSYEEREDTPVRT